MSTQQASTESVAALPAPAPMALSNREEDELRKKVRADAMKQCDSVVKAFADCATGRTVSVAWACRGQYREVQDCMRPISGEEAMKQRRKEFLQEKRTAAAAGRT